MRFITNIVVLALATVIAASPLPQGSDRGACDNKAACADIDLEVSLDVGSSGARAGAEAGSGVSQGTTVAGAGVIWGGAAGAGAGRFAW
jgi:hypothetical protein